MVRQPLRVSLPFFWLRASSKSFYQITKNHNCSFKTDKHANNRLSRQYVPDLTDFTGTFDSEEHISFTVAKFGVCHNSGKVNSSTSEKIGISGVTNKYRGNITVPLRRETDSHSSAVSGGLSSTKKFIVKLDKVNWPTFLNGPSYVTRKNFVYSNSSKYQVRKSRRLIRGYVILGNLTRKEFFWWIENIRPFNGRNIQQQEPQITFHTDASIIVWGEHCSGISTRRMIGKIARTLHKCFRKFAILTCTKHFSNLNLVR